MAFKKPVVNKVVADIESLSVYLRSVRKFGKSTLFRDVVIEKYNDPERGLLVGCGAEEGYALLDNLNATQCETWKDFVDLKTWLIKEKGKEHNIKMICFDVVDEIIPIAEKEIIRQSNIENPKKQCKTINGAFGGYGAGGAKVVELVKDYFLELKKAGFTIWALGHTKLKSIKEKSALDDGYQALSSVMSSNYESVFADILDCVLTGYIDKGIEEEVVGTTKDSNGNEVDKKVKYATSCERRLYFRGTDFIEAGCRFKAGTVPEYLLFDEPNMARKFIDTLEEGMRLSATVGAVKEIKKEVKKDIKREEVIEEDNEEEQDNIEIEKEVVQDVIEEDEDDDVVDVVANKELMTEIKSKFATATAETKAKIKEVLAINGDTGLNAKAKTKSLRQILNLLS